MHNLIIFASGGGSNARAIINYFRGSRLARVALIVSNNPDAGVLALARQEEIPFLVLDKAGLQGEALLEQLAPYKPSLLVLAGFLKKIPDAVVAAYPNRIINTHPALLPAYGGKGMYGHHVHRAVLAAGEKESGVTIHYVNERYDEGNILLQARCPTLPADTHETLAARVLRLEHFYFSRVIEFLLQEMGTAESRQPAGQ